ncbi:MAG: eukaryotic-like serine/threonine-protein kinase [Thermoleophilaceae bacterium]|nr:eukaryotic-like serine/threonine-protein kinase [Thermoleophilaceae bacterium]
MTAEFETGQRFGAYLLGPLLGRGGMGVVYQAQHVHLGRTVALKLLAPELSRSEDFRARFLRESRLAAELDHPGIVTVYDAGEVNGVLFIAMRFVRGTDLAALLAQRGPLAVDETLSILNQVASALDAAHAAGLVHRDVKPANVMIEGQRCYLADFGLTKRAASDSAQLTAAGQFLGTVDYVAPEQIEGRPVDGRADQYALGCVLFECLTGSRPYPRDSQVAVIYAQLREPPPRPSELRPDLPAAIDAVVARAMAKDPVARYSTCEEFVATAGTALSELTPTLPAQDPLAATTEPSAASVSAVPLVPPVAPDQPPTVPLQSAPSAAKRRSLALPLAGLGALALAGVAAALVVSGGSDKKQPTVAASPPETPAAPARAAAPTSGPHVVGSPIKVGVHPLGVVFRAGAIWVADSAGKSVTRVDEATASTTEIPVGSGPFDMAGNDTSVWSANAGSNTVSRIEAGSGKASPQFPVGSRPLFLTAENARVYVSNAGDDTVTVLDAHSGRQIGRAIPVGKDPHGITTAGGAAWVTNRGEDTVSQIVSGRVLSTIPVGHHPVGVTAGAGAIWVTNEGSNTVSRIKLPPGSSRVTATPVGRGPFGIGFGEGYVWVTNRTDGTVVRLDPATGKRVGAAVPVPGEPVSVATRGGSVWISSYGAGTLSRIKP